MKKRIFLVSIVFIVFCVFSSLSHSTPLNLTSGTPDIFSAFISVNYNSSTQNLNSQGFAFEIDDDGVGPAEQIVNGLMNLSATIDNSGNLISGSLTIQGTVPTLNYTSGTILTGNIIDFGFPDAGGDPLEFLFEVTGGDAAGIYGPKGGVIMSYTGFPGSFQSSFMNYGDGVSDTFSVSGEPVPEPSTIAMFLIGIGGLVVSKSIKISRKRS